MTCIHRYVINDVKVIEEYDSVSIEFNEEYTVVCVNCGAEKTVDELSLLAMKRTGLIDEERR